MNNKAAKILGLIPDSLYLRLRYYTHTKKWLHLSDPKRFNEKLQWLKLYNRRPEHTLMVDKYLVRDYIKEIIGEEYLIPLIGAWDSVDEIDFDSLPERFVIKCNHNSGEGMYICADKSKMNVEKVKADLKRGMEQDYYLCDREWPYKNVPRKIVAEEYLDDGSGRGINDYKVFNFNGEPYIIQVDFDRFIDHKKNLYTTEWELCDFSFNYPAHPEIEIPKPEKLDEMLELSRKLSAGAPFMRTDFYSVNGKLYFGELTFFPATGYGKFEPDEIDFELGEKIILPNKKIR
jgi:hypothetical protein